MAAVSDIRCAVKAGQPVKAVYTAECNSAATEEKVDSFGGQSGPTYVRLVRIACVVIKCPMFEFRGSITGLSEGPRRVSRKAPK